MVVVVTEVSCASGSAVSCSFSAWLCCLHQQFYGLSLGMSPCYIASETSYSGDFMIGSTLLTNFVFCLNQPLSTSVVCH